MKIYVPIESGTNGEIIKWEITGTGIAIFEWDEAYNNRPHYHQMLPTDNNQHNKINKTPTDLVDEPWNSTYFN